MKRTGVFIFLIGICLIFSACSKDEQFKHELKMKSKEYKAIKLKRTFEGVCTFVEPVPNTWYDETDDWRVTGTTIWTQPDPAVFSGTAELFVCAKNPFDENRGKWEMKWEGGLAPNAEGTGFDIVATATGVGVEGKVKGMKAKWTYTMNYIGDDFPNPANPTFFYKIKGSIEAH